MMMANWPHLLKVYVISFEEKQIHNEGCSRAELKDGCVKLVLVENMNELYEDWANAIVTAERLIDRLEKERQHEMSHPNFVKALQSQVKYLKAEKQQTSYL